MSYFEPAMIAGFESVSRKEGERTDCEKYIFSHAHYDAQLHPEMSCCWRGSRGLERLRKIAKRHRQTAD